MEINSKKLDELYKEWSGEHHTTNSNKTIHDGSECTDFAEFCLKYALNKKVDSGENTIQEKIKKHGEYCRQFHKMLDDEIGLKNKGTATYNTIKDYEKLF